ncbi:hypothetical protein GCM10009853_010290 [Glycomyces scopariae]
MGNESNSDGSFAKTRVVVSVLAILAFFGIANWEDLSGSKSADSDADQDLADIGIGDCFELEVFDDIAPVSCDTPGEYVYEVLGRVPFNEYAYEAYWGHSPSTEHATEDHYEIASCALELAWTLDDGSDRGRIAQSAYSGDGRAVLCAEPRT